jgi:hypothetical protein
MASPVVGAGKIQFLLNGKEIAWVRASSTADPKLRSANGTHYLVRRVDLSSGKNRFEILLNGKRLKFATFTE